MAMVAWLIVSRYSFIVVPTQKMLIALLYYRHPIPFTAHLDSGSDAEITVFPMSGTLTPSDTKGTSFLVTYRPTMYGKKHHAKFIVQVSSSSYNCIIP